MKQMSLLAALVLTCGCVGVDGSTDAISVLETSDLENRIFYVLDATQAPLTEYVEGSTAVGLRLYEGEFLVAWEAPAGEIRVHRDSVVAAWRVGDLDALEAWGDGEHEHIDGEVAPGDEPTATPSTTFETGTVIENHPVEVESELNANAPVENLPDLFVLWGDPYADYWFAHWMAHPFCPDM